MAEYKWPEAEKRTHPRYWNCRHEALAVSIGLGYTKACGRMSAQLFHSSVGPTQATMALRTAYQELIPMLVSSGQTTTSSGRAATRECCSSAWSSNCVQGSAPGWAREGGK